MRKFFSGAVACGLATAGALAWAGPGAAQEDPGPPVNELEADFAIEGTFISVDSVDDCNAPEGAFSFLNWGIFEGHDLNWDDLLAGNVTAVADGSIETEDGSWSLAGEFDELVGEPEEIAAAAEAAAADPRAVDVYGPFQFTIDDVDYSFAAYCDTLLLAEFTSHETEFVPGDPIGLAHVDAGDAVTVGPLSNCPEPAEGEALFYSVWTDELEEPLAEGSMALAADGSWDDIAFTAPDGATFGYVFLDCGTGDGGVTASYAPLVFEVGEAGEPPTNPPTRPPTTPPPATPIVRPPNGTG